MCWLIISMPWAELSGQSSLAGAAPPTAEESSVRVGQTALQPPWECWDRNS